jgi:hypothetical protein
VVILGKVVIDKEEAEAWLMFDEMHEKMKENDPEEIEELINEAVKDTRRQRTARKVRNTVSAVRRAFAAETCQHRTTSR